MILFHIPKDGSHEQRCRGDEERANRVHTPVIGGFFLWTQPPMQSATNSADKKPKPNYKDKKT